MATIIQQNVLNSPFLSNLSPVNKTAIFIDGVDGVDLIGGGRGNYLRPYKNASYALTQITDASPSKQYVLFFSGNITDAGQIYFSPNISFFSYNSITITNSMNVLADPAWATAALGSNTNWQNVIFTKKVNLDFSAMTPTTNPTGT